MSATPYWSVRSISTVDPIDESVARRQSPDSVLGCRCGRVGADERHIKRTSAYWNRAGEEQAIESLQQGAVDYVLKMRMGRLIPAVKRALHEAEERAKRRRAERALQGVSNAFA